MRVDKDKLDELCKDFDLLEYAQEDYEFTKNGSVWATHCPLHVDKTASLTIYPNSNSFYCFSCGVGGNLTNWINKIENVTWDKAVEKTLQLLNVNQSSIYKCDTLLFLKKAQKNQSQVSETSDRKILSKDYYENNFADEIPQEWIEEGISADAMRLYEIRIDKNSNRIVYPLYDNQGNLVGIKGRTRYKNFKDMGIPKYTSYFKIGKIDFFVGMKQNSEEIVKNSEVILFEGIKSCMKAWDYGYKSTLAVEGGHINEEQVIIIIQMKIKNVIIAFDSDKPVKSIVQNAKVLRRFCNVYIMRSDEIKPEDKMSPVDKGKDFFWSMYRKRVRI